MRISSPCERGDKDLHDTYFVPTYKSNWTLFAFLQAQTENERSDIYAWLRVDPRSIYTSSAYSDLPFTGISLRSV